MITSIPFKPRAAMYSVPFAYDPPLERVMVVRASINGSAFLPFMLDTGCQDSLLLKESVARELGLIPEWLNPFRSHLGILTYRMNELNVKLYGLDVHGGPSMVAELPFALDANCNLLKTDRYAGIIGARMLDGMAVGFDFKHNMLTVCRGSDVQFLHSGWRSLPLLKHRSRALIDVAINEGEPYNAIIDTGSTITTAPESNLPLRSQHQSAKIVTLTSAFETDWVQLSEAKVGPFTCRDIRMFREMPGTRNVVGIDVLSRLRFGINFHQKLIYIPDAETESPA